MSSVQDSGSQDTDSDIIQPVVDCYSSFITVRCTASDSDVDRFQAKIVTAAATLLSYSCNTSQKHYRTSTGPQHRFIPLGPVWQNSTKVFIDPFLRRHSYPIMSISRQ